MLSLNRLHILNGVLDVSNRVPFEELYQTPQLVTDFAQNQTFKMFSASFCSSFWENYNPEETNKTRRK